MKKQFRYKIALVGDILGVGGAERVQARLSIFFDSKGIEVHHIIVRNVIKYEYAGILFNMGLLKNEFNSFSNRIKRFKSLKKYLDNHQFDFIIDFRVKNRFLQEFVIANWVYKTPYIISVRSFKTDYYFPKNLFFARIIYKKAYGFVTVSDAIKNKIEIKYNCKNVQTIYNPILKEYIKKESGVIFNIDFKFIFGIGRMKDNIKQFNHLIEAYKNSIASTKGIKLVLAGDGAFKKELELLVENEQLKNQVVFLGHQDNPFPYLEKAFFTALTSKNEGFPNVLLESLVSSTPVIAYDCESGPSEIINHEENGLLVENQNIKEFTKAINRMINETTLYNFCKNNALASVDRFNTDTIGNKWLHFLNIDR